MGFAFCTSREKASFSHSEAFSHSIPRLSPKTIFIYQISKGLEFNMSTRNPTMLQCKRLRCMRNPKPCLHDTAPLPPLPTLIPMGSLEGTHLQDTVLLPPDACSVTPACTACSVPPACTASAPDGGGASCTASVGASAGRCTTSATAAGSVGGTVGRPSGTGLGVPSGSSGVSSEVAGGGSTRGGGGGGGGIAYVTGTGKESRSAFEFPFARKLKNQELHLNLPGN